MEPRPLLSSWLAACITGSTVAIAICTAACLSGCGGDSGGTVASKESPVILSAFLIENAPGNSTPEAGELLELFIDEAVELTGAAVSNADFALPAGASLGSNPSVSLADERRVRIVLGGGVAFTPGTSSIAFAAEQDAIRSTTTGKLGTGGTALTITVGDGDRPVITNVTLNSIPSPFNGTGTAGGVLQVPANGFLIDLTYGDVSSPIATTKFQVTANRGVVVNGTAQPAGADLFPSLSPVTANNATASILVPGNIAFPDGSVILTVLVFDISGQGSMPATFAFRAVQASAANRPFEAQQTWFIDLSRDLETITSAKVPCNPPLPNPCIVITVVETPNGIPDLLEILSVIGLQHSPPIPDVSGTKDSNEVTIDILKTEIIAQLALLFPGVNIAFTFSSPGNFGPVLQPAYGAVSFSQICLAAKSNIGALGVALLDPNNGRQDNDCAHPGSQPAATNRLGVFLHTLIDNGTAGVNGNSGGVFRSTFDPFTPLNSGTAIGNNGADGTRLLNILAAQAGDGRQIAMENAIDRLGRFLAVVLAHETGHSMGLVLDDPMPAGLYGGDPTHFPGSTTGHISISPALGIFPVGAQEIMEPGISFGAAITNGTGFNPLILAYLRERALYDVR
jgi:hypothetical protein